MPVITTECYHLSLPVYPSTGKQHCNGSYLSDLLSFLIQLPLPVLHWVYGSSPGRGSEHSFSLRQLRQCAAPLGRRGLGLALDHLQCRKLRRIVRRRGASSAGARSLPSRCARRRAGRAAPGPGRGRRRAGTGSPSAVRVRAGRRGPTAGTAIRRRAKGCWISCARGMSATR